MIIPKPTLIRWVERWVNNGNAIVKINKLSVLKITSIKKPGYYNDGGGLWLQISKLGGKSWVFRYTLHKKRREMGLGSVQTVSLAEARDKTLLCRKAVHEGRDPIEEQKAMKQQAIINKSNNKSFAECATNYIDAHQSGWKNKKHVKQWQSTLSHYALPIIGKLPVLSIDTKRVSEVLEPIWHNKTETASRLRGRIEAILDWATVRGYRHGENPARWKGHLDKIFPAKNKVKKVKHFAALPYKDLASFMAMLKKREGISARALEFSILTATRSCEVRGATWLEIDLESKTWTIPAERMKAGKEHRIPLSDEAITLIKNISQLSNSKYIFPAPRNGQLSDMSLTGTLRRMNFGHITQHGFRSTFRDWAGETTHYSREVIEHALAHQLADKAEAAYQRGDLLEKRSKLMADWAQFCKGS